MKSNITRRVLLTAGITLIAIVQIPRALADDEAFVPAFAFQNWIYQSFLVLPTPAEASAKPGKAVSAEKWAIGQLTLADSPDGYAASGNLVFAPGVKLKIKVEGTPGKGDIPATFETTGVGVEGVTKGAEYQLIGWVFRGDDGKVESVRGSVRAVRGPDSSPSISLGGAPAGTVGYFVINKAE